MKLVLRPYVELEVQRAGGWYEERQTGLKERFFRAVDETFSRIAKGPRLYAVVHLDIRRAALVRFPYGVYYTLIKDEIHVLAVVHDARHPSVWRRPR